MPCTSLPWPITFLPLASSLPRHAFPSSLSLSLAMLLSSSICWSTCSAFPAFLWLRPWSSLCCLLRPLRRPPRPLYPSCHQPHYLLVAQRLTQDGHRPAAL